jgi:transposase
VIPGLMTDDEWAIVEPFLATASLRGGRRPVNHRRVLDGILSICRTGTPCRDLPEALGNWNSIWRQFRRVCESGVWDVMLQGRADGGGELDALQMIDTTTIRVHRCAAGETAGCDFRHLAFSRRVHHQSPSPLPSAFPSASY